MEPQTRSPVPRRALAGALTSLLVVAACSSVEPDDPGRGPAVSPTDRASAVTTPSGAHSLALTTVATDLAVPWGLAFLPDGRAVVTERDTGNVLLLAPGEGTSRTVEVAGTVQVAASSEGGLLGVAVSPDFAEDHTLFLYASRSDDNVVLRAELTEDHLGEPDVVLEGIPTSERHDGGRMTFGPDGHLYVSTGDAGEPELAQDPGSLAGKILRLAPDGSVPEGNPWHSPVFSLGHRNVQGLAFDADGQLWASEFGDQSWDELNRIVAGGNYGWPFMEGHDRGPDDESAPPEGLIAPLAVWPTDEASPSGLAFHQGSFWLAALRGTRLWEVPRTADGVGTPVAHLADDFGRLRTVAVTPEGRLWVTTSNTDGRGEPHPGDDQILEIGR